ncbi:MAG TPA: tRNA (guanosine(37)-N1)-methyltransferase TrmD [Candidatus Methylomirabilis sp.]|nr:tRNA (guanosine(37)-N1)-methyltransferase TrmD [Candidatus Methylomirabilis sp.]
MKKRPLRVDVLTIFPEVFSGYLGASILGRAQKKRLLDVRVHQLRRWTHDRHNTVDDKPFGGGPGMVMKVQPFHEALVSLGVRSKKTGRRTTKAGKTRVIVTSASGKLFTHADAVRLSKYDRLVFLCGRYEGIDERVVDRLADEALSIGPYVLTGGELPALVMLDAVARHRPGVLGKEASLAEESWSDGGGEYPQYTRPEKYLGMKVPDVLMSGNHKKIAEWRKGKRSAP